MKKVILSNAVLREGGGKTNPWVAIEMIFLGDLRFTMMYFAPTSYKDRRILSEQLRHIMEVYDEDYDSIPYCTDFYEFSKIYIEKLSVHYGEERYALLVERKDRVGLASTVPFISRLPDLEYQGVDELFKIGEPKKKEAKTLDRTPQETINLREQGKFTF